MKTGTLGCFGLVIIFYTTLLMPNSVNAGVENISLLEVVEEDVLVRGRTAYYTYRLRITNNSTPLSNVTAVVSSQSRSIRVTERDLYFGNVATNAQIQSTDVFTIRVGAAMVPNLSDLLYTFSGKVAVMDDDTVPPNISAQLSRQANENGWHNAPVNVSFDCSDDVAIATCSSDVTVDVDGENQVIVGTAVDASGNTASAQIRVNLDSQAPSVLASLSSSTDTSPTDKATLLQKIAIDTLSEANSQISIYQIENNQNSLVTSFSSDNNGEGFVQNISLDIGVSDFLVESLDVAHNQGEANLNIERLQCSAELVNRPFYLDSPIMTQSQLSALQPGERSFSGVYHQFKGDAEGLISVVPGFINDDVLLDWVIVDGDETDITILVNDGTGVFTSGTTKTTGFTKPVAALLSNLVDSAALDLAVAHEDGVVAIYAGTGDGSFSTQATELFVNTEPVVDLISGDFNHDGFADLLVVTATKLELLTRHSAQSIKPVISNGNFTNGLAAWMSNATGHTSTQPAGVVAKSANGAQLFEKGSFIVSLFQGFTPSQDFTSLSFNISSVFLEMPEGAIPDVLEVSLLNSNNQSLVPTFHPSATSFLNVAADGTVNAASGVNYSSGQVSVDISAISDDAILYFDLVGHPPGQGSTFVVSNVDAGESMVVDNSYTSFVISNDLTGANGATYCDAITNAPPILVSDLGAEQIVIFQENGNGTYVIDSTLAQGGQ